MTNGQDEFRKKLDRYFIGFLRKTFRWSPAYREVLARTFVKTEMVATTYRGKTRSKKVNFHRCEQCQRVDQRRLTHVDHIESFIDRRGGLATWDTHRDRMFVSAKELQLLCKKPCHYEKTQKENAERRKNKKAKEK